MEAKLLWTDDRDALGRLIGVVVLALSLVGSPAAGTDEVSLLLEARLAREAVPAFGSEAAVLERFYAERGFEPLWSGDPKRRARGRLLVLRLSAAAEHGLESERYRAAAITRLLEEEDPAAQAERDHLSSLGLMRYAGDLRQGLLDPGGLQQGRHLTRPVYEPLAMLKAAAANPDLGRFLRRLAPSDEGYANLQEILAELRLIAARGGWTRLESEARLERGERHEAVPRLRRRLLESGDLKAAEDAGGLHFDGRLEAAVKRFQARHGLLEDGIVGPETRAALAIPVRARIEQVRVNLERWRWRQVMPGGRHVLVNIPDYTLELAVAGRSKHEARVIVGRPAQRTPIFSANMTRLVVNPDWVVPPSIARREILPRILEDPGYLEAGSFEVWSGWGPEAVRLDPAAIDWAAAVQEDFPFKLRQAPGPDNALGRIKFVLPNPMNIYLHDTPTKHLFARHRRAFSNGCIRVEDPFRLAWALLASQDRATTELRQARESKVQREIRLDSSLPVHLVYWTVWRDEAKRAHFREDIYGHDARLKAALGQEADAAASAAMPRLASDGSGCDHSP